MYKISGVVIMWTGFFCVF